MVDYYCVSHDYYNVTWSTASRLSMQYLEQFLLTKNCYTNLLKNFPCDKIIFIEGYSLYLFYFIYTLRVSIYVCVYVFICFIL